MNKTWIITGSRADTGCLKYIIENSKYTHVDIKISDKNNIECNKDNVYMNIKSDEIPLMFGKIVIEFTKLYRMLKPKLIIVLGDRWEILASCLPAIFEKIPIAHIGGGEVSKGSYDEIFRYSISKIAKYHFVISDTCKERLEGQGVKKNIYVVGSPRLDYDVDAIKRLRFIHKYGLIIVHPETLGKGMGKKIKILISALKRIDINYFIISPNVDIEGNVIEKAFKKISDASLYKFILLGTVQKLEHYLALMKSCDVMIGNSSAGIIESPTFKLPTINIGNRQEGRDRQKNVIDVGWDKDLIRKAILKGLSRGFRASIRDIKNVYKNNASEKIIKILEEL